MSFKELEDIIKDTKVIRIHRSYMVNTIHISTAKKTKKGYGGAVGVYGVEVRAHTKKENYVADAQLQQQETGYAEANAFERQHSTDTM